MRTSLSTSWENTGNVCNESRPIEMSGNRGDFRHLRLSNGIGLHLHHTAKFKTIRIDIFIQELLREKHSTRISLISRLLERGTQVLPDMRSMNRFLDGLYGADFSVEVDQLGDRQLVHLYLELIDDRFLRGDPEDLLGRGIDFLHDVLREPTREGRGFRSDYLRQEKKSLSANISALFNDKSLYAHRRCFEEMCSGEPYSLSPLGNPRDFDAITPVGLLKYHYALLSQNPLEIYVCGRLQEEGQIRLWEDFFDWKRQLRPVFSAVSGSAKNRSKPRQIFEAHDVSQGRLVLGYRTFTPLLNDDYPALVLLNLLWGGDHNSRLFRFVREEAGLCYFIASQLEPLCSLLFVSAGIKTDDYDRVLLEVANQLEVMREKRFAEEELKIGKSILENHLLSLGDDRGGLVDFYYRQEVVGMECSRVQFQQRLQAVTAEDVSRIAWKLELDTTFFLHGDEVAARSCA